MRLQTNIYIKLNQLITYLIFYWEGNHIQVAMKYEQWGTLWPMRWVIGYR